MTTTLPTASDNDAAQLTVAFDSDQEPTLELLGGKCASLVTMTSAGMPVPPGFAITTASYDAFLYESGLRAEIAACLEGLDPNDIAAVDDCSARIRAQIESRPVPQAVSDALRTAYTELQSPFACEVPVAVRSSATAEDLPDASFAGQQDTYLWLLGYEAVRHHVRACWASLYTSRAILYRLKNNISEDDLSMAVAVQKMVNARVAGVAMTMDPGTGDRSKVAIDASWGVGEMVVSGLVTPDHIVLDKVVLSVVREVIGDKHAELVPDAAAGALVEREVEAERRTTRCLTDAELEAVAAMAKRAEKHYRCPQDVEWALDADLPPGEDLVLLQARPETVHSSKPTAAPSGSASNPTGSAGFQMPGMAAMTSGLRDR